MIKKFEIKDILSAVNTICKIKKNKSKITERKYSEDKNDILTLNNQVKPSKSDILVLDEMIE